MSNVTRWVLAVVADDDARSFKDTNKYYYTNHESAASYWLLSARHLHSGKHQQLNNLLAVNNAFLRIVGTRIGMWVLDVSLHPMNMQQCMFGRDRLKAEYDTRYSASARYWNSFAALQCSAVHHTTV